MRASRSRALTTGPLTLWITPFSVVVVSVDSALLMLVVLLHQVDPDGSFDLVAQPAATGAGSAERDEHWLDAPLHRLAGPPREVVEVVGVHHDDAGVLVFEGPFDGVVEPLVLLVVRYVLELPHAGEPEPSGELWAADDGDLLAHVITSSDSISSADRPASLPRAIARMFSTSRSFAWMYEMIGVIDTGWIVPSWSPYANSAASVACSNAMRLSASSSSRSAGPSSSAYWLSAMYSTSSSRFRASRASDPRVNSSPPSMKYAAGSMSAPDRASRRAFVAFRKSTSALRNASYCRVGSSPPSPERSRS